MNLLAPRDKDEMKIMTKGQTRNETTMGKQGILISSVIHNLSRRLLKLSIYEVANPKGLYQIKNSK